MISPITDIANNLINFMAFRFQQSWKILNCELLTGNPSPIITVIDPNTGIVISNNLLQHATTIPSSSSGNLLVSTPNSVMTSVSNIYTKINNSFTLTTSSPSYNINTTSLPITSSSENNKKCTSSFFIFILVCVNFLF